MSNPEDHLVRSGSDSSGALDLSAVTGLSRLQLGIRRLAAGERTQFDSGPERFLYVLEGSGVLQAAADITAIEPGDFVALAAGESAELASEPGISVLFGQSGN